MPHALTRVRVRLHTTKRTKAPIYKPYKTFLNKKKPARLPVFF